VYLWLIIPTQLRTNQQILGSMDILYFEGFIDVRITEAAEICAGGRNAL
jgi:hypothetical protein